MTSKHEKTELRVGTFVLVLTVLFIALLAYIGIKKDLFADRATYYVISTTGENVERGIPVRLSGFRIGQVTEVDLSHVGRVVIEIAVLDKYHEWFRTDSQIILVQGGFIGNTYLKLVPGSQDSPILEENTQIKLNKIGGLDEILAEAEPVIKNLKEIVANVNAITMQILDKDGPAQTILTNLEGMSRDLRSDAGLVGYLTKSPEPVQKLDSLLAGGDRMMQRVTRLAEAATERVEDFEPLQHETVELVREVNSFVKELKTFREDLRPAVENAVAITEDVRGASKNLAQLRARTEYTIRLGTELLERLNATWPLSQGKTPAPPAEHPLP